MNVSSEIKRQTKLVMDFLEKAEPFILKKRFVPVAPEEIDEYIKNTNRIIPLDFYYWLTHVGAGTVYFLSDSLEIPSIQDIINNEVDGRSYSESPKNCFKRITLDYLGTPILRVIDSLIIDEDGCAPVIDTIEYSDLTGKVFASSWPMYVLNQAVEALCDAVNSLNTSTEGTKEKLKEKFNFQDDTENALVKFGIKLCLANTGLDTKLNDACLRSIDNNNTTNNKEEAEELDNIMSQSMGKCAEQILKWTSESYTEPAEKKYDLKEIIAEVDKEWERSGKYYSGLIEEDFSKNSISELVKALHDSPFRPLRRSIAYELYNILSDEDKLKILKPIYEDDNEFDLELKCDIFNNCCSVDGFLE